MHRAIQHIMNFDGALWLKNKPYAALHLTNSSSFDRDVESRKQMLEIIVIHLQTSVVTKRKSRSTDVKNCGSEKGWGHSGRALKGFHAVGTESKAG